MPSDKPDVVGDLLLRELVEQIKLHPPSLSALMQADPRLQGEYDRFTLKPTRRYGLSRMEQQFGFLNSLDAGLRNDIAHAFVVPEITFRSAPDVATAQRRSVDNFLMIEECQPIPLAETTIGAYGLLGQPADNSLTMAGMRDLMDSIPVPPPPPKIVASKFIANYTRVQKFIPKSKKRRQREKCAKDPRNWHNVPNEEAYRVGDLLFVSEFAYDRIATQFIQATGRIKLPA